MTNEEAIKELMQLEFYGRPFDNSPEECIKSERKMLALEHAIRVLNQQPIYYPPCEDCHKKMDAIRNAYDRLQQPCDDCINFPKSAVKMRGEGYIVYNYDWLKENWQTELKMVGVDWREQMQEPVLDKIKAIVTEWSANTWTDNLSYECMRKIADIVTEREG